MPTPNLKQEIAKKIGHSFIENGLAIDAKSALKIADQILELVGKAIESCIPEKVEDEKTLMGKEEIDLLKKIYESEARVNQQLLDMRIGYNQAVDEMREKLKNF